MAFLLLLAFVTGCGCLIAATYGDTRGRLIVGLIGAALLATSLLIIQGHIPAQLFVE